MGLAAWLRRFETFTVDPDRPVVLTDGGGIRGPRSVPLLIG